MLINAFFNSHSNYYPVIWMCHSPALNNKINRLHERCLRMIYNDKTSGTPIHYRNIQALAIEMHKVADGISPEIMNEMFFSSLYYNFI